MWIEMSGRTIVVGDIQGCFDELNDLLERVGLGADERVVAVGDLIVKGPESAQVLELFMEDERFSSVLGNHDRALLRYWHGEDVQLTKEQEKTRVELQAHRERYAAYLERLPLMIDLGSYLVVHAGVRPGVPLDEQALEDLTELRTLGEDRTSREGTPWYEVYTGEKTVLFGHWPAREPRRSAHAIGLDTGCVYGHRLTACVIETGELLSVPARRTYVQPKQPLP
jgi:hypothetical protein